jgi:DNA-binding PadR family transcriptional regulator/predicted small metal-binding protein
MELDIKSLTCYNIVVTTTSNGRNVMDFFLLGLVSRCSLNTVYRLQQEAGLQPGGIQPTLRRLEEEGLLCRSEEAKRRRRLMKVTDKGARLLEQHWKDCIQDSPDIESILRCATVAILMGDFQYAYQYLVGVADEHERNYDRATHIASFRSRHFSPLDCYAFMRMQWQVAKRHSAAEVLRQIAKEVQHMKPTHKPTSKEEEMKIEKDMPPL